MMILVTCMQVQHCNVNNIYHIYVLNYVSWDFILQLCNSTSTKYTIYYITKKLELY